MTDNCTKITETTKMNLVNSTNKIHLKIKFKKQKKERGSQALVRAYDPVHNLDKIYWECKKK